MRRLSNTFVSWIKGSLRLPFFSVQRKPGFWTYLVVSGVLHLGVLHFVAHRIYDWGRSQTADVKPLHLNLLDPYDIQLRGRLDAQGASEHRLDAQPQPVGSGGLVGREGASSVVQLGKQSLGVNTESGSSDSQMDPINYHTLDELTTKPEVVSDADLPPPVYLPDIHPLPVMVFIRIGVDGQVEAVQLGENFLSDVAQRYVINAASRLKFSPGKIGVQAVRSQVRIMVNLDSALTVQ
jgi:hypothetical protein